MINSLGLCPRIARTESNVSRQSGTLYVVATPIGNLGDISARALEVLDSVDRIAAEDTRHSGRLLKALGISGRLSALHQHNEGEATARVLGWLQAGEDVALISDAGTPLISDPGFEVVKAAREDGVLVVPLPGASAVIAALSVSGLACDRFRFEGFPPRKSGERQRRLQALEGETATLVFYESSHRILETLGDCITVFGADRLAVIARELTKLYETVRQDSLQALVQWMRADSDQQKGEFVLIIAGRDQAVEVSDGEVDRVLDILLDELPPARAASVAARLTGRPRKALYARAIERG